MGRFRDKLADAFSGEDLEQAKWYFIKAAILMACLMAVAYLAPFLPSVLLPFILMAFSMVSTMGALYYTVINRFHRQYRLAADGQLSRLNRKWTVRLVAFLVAFLISAILFILEAPKWDVLEWVLTWLAVPLYYAAFMLVRRTLRREYAPRFYKAHAMLWSFWIVGIALCLIYALLSALLPTAEYDTLRAAFDSVTQPYAASPSALMSDIGKLTWYVDAVTAFGVSQVSDWSPLVAFICRFAIYAGVFFGLVNQFGFCLLDKDEIRSEFQLLPSCEDERRRMTQAGLAAEEGMGGDPYDAPPACSDEPIRSRYALAIAAVLVITTIAFLAIEFEVAKAKATSTRTLIEAFVDEQTENAIAIVDGKLAEIREREESIRSKAEWIEQLVEERNETLAPLVDEYYNRCLDNVDSYLDWYDGVFGWWSKLWKDLGDFSANDAARTFKERIAKGANSSQIESAYKMYQEQIDRVRSEAITELTSEELMAIFGSATDPGIDGDEGSFDLDLWQPLDDPSTVKDVLLNTGEGTDRDSMRERIVDLIEQARSDALAQLGFDSAAEDDADDQVGSTD